MNNKPKKEEDNVKKKDSKRREKGLIVAILILALLLIITLPMTIFFIIGLSSRSDNFVTDIEVAEDYAEDVSEEYEREEEEVESVLKEVRDRMKDKDPYNYYGNIRYGASGVYHKINDDGVLYKLNRSLSLGYPFGSEVFKKRNMKSMLEMGFSEYAHIDNDTHFNTIKEDKDNTYFARKNEESGSEIVCVVGIFVVDCSNEKWKVDDEDIVVKVVEAYKKETGQVIGSVVLDFQKEPSNDKAEIAYMRTDVSAHAIDDGVGIDGFSGYYFYKKFGDSEWVYAGKYVVTQAGRNFYDCSELSDEVKEIFGKPYICFDQKNGGDFYLDGSRFYIYGQTSD